MPNARTLYAVDPTTAKGFDTAELRKNFLIGSAFVRGEINLTYTHYDRLIVGGAVPGDAPVVLDHMAENGTASFLDRREAGILNIGGPGRVEAGGQGWDMDKGDILYLGMGAGPVTFSGEGRFYIASAPAHQAHPATLIRPEDAERVTLGAAETSNYRSICKSIHPGGVASCQLLMGYTQLHDGSVWNTMPAHLHDRRMEAYLYFDVADGQCVFHFMGQPQETRHLVIRNEEIAVSPPWSIHSGAGTGSYTFCWVMAGDNMDFTDMDMVSIGDLA